MYEYVIMDTPEIWQLSYLSKMGISVVLIINQSTELLRFWVDRSANSK